MTTIPLTPEEVDEYERLCLCGEKPTLHRYRRRVLTTIRALHASNTAMREALEKVAPLVAAVRGLSYGSDWNNGIAAKHAGYRRKVLKALPVAEEAIQALAASPSESPNKHLSAGLSVEDAVLALAASPVAEPSPIPMILHCPACGAQHIDAPEPINWRDASRDAAGTVGARRTNPHCSHLCADCGRIWRPADVPTEGVAAIQSRGKADSPAPIAEGEKADAAGEREASRKAAAALNGWVSDRIAAGSAPTPPDAGEIARDWLIAELLAHGEFGSTEGSNRSNAATCADAILSRFPQDVGDVITELATLRACVGELTKPIGMQDVRLAVGEGQLTIGDVLAGVNAELRRRSLVKGKGHE